MTKFNLLLAGEVGEPLGDALINGLILTVNEIVATADELVTQIEDPISLTKEKIDELNKTQDLLDAINRGEINYLPLSASSTNDIPQIMEGSPINLEAPVSLNQGQLQPNWELVFPSPIVPVPPDPADTRVYYSEGEIPEL